MAAETLVANGTHRFTLTATYDGAAWNLADATVTLLLKDASGTTTTKSATIVSAAAGTARYDCLTTDLPSVGLWHRSWRVVQGSTDLTGEPIPFAVVASP